MNHEMKPSKVNVPNCITGVRILGTISLLFIAPLSTLFYIIYTFCGLSDVLDGYIARKTNSSSEFGAKLDSVADILFYVVTILKLLPILWKVLPTWIWYVVGLIVALRLSSYVTAAIKFRRFSSMHTKLNKACGATVFLLPYFMAIDKATTGYCIVICAVAVVSSAQELILHLINSEYHSNMKGLF